LREQLIAAVKDIGSAEQAASWAHRVMGAKNTLAVADAERVERAFQERLLIVASEALTPALRPLRRLGREKRRRCPVVDKSVLALLAPRRIRDRDHVKLVSNQPCLVCGRRPADAHHLHSALKADAPAVGFARCFLRLANLPNFALDRLSRYEAPLWRQAGWMLYALEKLDRRKPQERARRGWIGM
jgi:hypothetical protein